MRGGGLCTCTRQVNPIYSISKKKKPFTLAQLFSIGEAILNIPLLHYYSIYLYPDSRFYHPPYLVVDFRIQRSSFGLD